MTPDDRKYTKTHEWIKVEGNVAVAGITHHAQEALGDITYVETPKTGKKVKQGDQAGTIESVKAASEIYAPISGEIVSANAELEKAPELVNQDPYGKGWMFKIGNFNAQEPANLLSADQYKAILEK